MRIISLSWPPGPQRTSLPHVMHAAEDANVKMSRIPEQRCARATAARERDPARANERKKKKKEWSRPSMARVRAYR